jgi:TfoX/Sxy family transcriptional regulator of competence genes
MAKKEKEAPVNLIGASSDAWDDHLLLQSWDEAQAEYEV